VVDGGWSAECGTFRKVPLLTGEMDKERQQYVMTGRFALTLTFLLVVVRALAAQEELPPDKAPLADAVRSDLSKLADLERSYFAANKRFTVDLNALTFVAVSGARIGVSYASARTFSASASHVRLAPYLCFIIVSSPTADSPAEKPFCTDSRLGTAASALAGDATESASAANAAGAGAPSAPSAPSAPKHRAARPATPSTLNPAQFAERLRAAAGSPRDSVIVVVQFTVEDARYDPSRSVLELSLERVPLPAAMAQGGTPSSAQLALACFTRPAFLCGTDGLTYIARDIWRVPPARAPDPETLRSGLTVQARFAVGRRDDARGPALTLLALVLQARGEVLSRWEPAGPR
jgi:hypothetical protein